MNRRSQSHESFVPVCHHCGIKGHIRPHCYKLNSSQKKVNRNSMKKYKVKYVEKIVKPKTKSVWVRKSELNCHVVHTAYKAHNTHMWYLDSGCSRHMSGDKSLFSKVEKFDGGLVTFGDGKKSRVVGK